jgi:hypothetical protein
MTKSAEGAHVRLAITKTLHRFSQSPSAERVCVVICNSSDLGGSSVLCTGRNTPWSDLCDELRRGQDGLLVTNTTKPICRLVGWSEMVDFVEVRPIPMVHRPPPDEPCTAFPPDSLDLAADLDNSSNYPPCEGGNRTGSHLRPDWGDFVGCKPEPGVPTASIEPLESRTLSVSELELIRQQIRDGPSLGVSTSSAIEIEEDVPPPSDPNPSPSSLRPEEARPDDPTRPSSSMTTEAKVSPRTYTFWTTAGGQNSTSSGTGYIGVRGAGTSEQLRPKTPGLSKVPLRHAC